VRALVVAAFVLMWAGWRVDLYFIYDFYPAIVGAALVCGALIRRWWAVLLSLVPVLLSVGLDMADEGPGFLAVLALHTPILAASLALGVLAGKSLAAALRRSQPRRPVTDG
jgi:hypothetical protein